MIRQAIRGAAIAALTVTALVTPPAQAADAPYKVLVLSETGPHGWWHDSIPTAVQTIRDLGAANGFTVDVTNDSSGVFTAANLANYRAVVFASTTGEILDPAEQSAFEDYIRAGGGYAGIHSAADTEYDWPFYGGLVGAYFNTHPAQQQARVTTEDRAHPSTSHLGADQWSRWDEWYDYLTNPRNSVRVLQSLDESSYSPGAPMGDHPITWCQPYQGGRSWYTGLGHTKESYADPAFRAMLLGGIQYAAKAKNADCRPENGYTPLYDGSTTGWSQAGPGGFTNSDATLASYGGMGLNWYSAKQYTSYSLKLDWKLTGDANSGVFIGFPPSSDPWSAVNNGYEIQIDATDSADKTTGAVYGFQGADLTARDAALNPAGEWNTYELLVEGEHLQVLLNGVKINDFTNTDPARSLAGHIGLQNHGTGEEAAFRNIRIKELGTAPPTTVQAESYAAASGVSSYAKAGANGGQTLGYIDPGDWARYDQLPVNGATGLRARVVSGGTGGTLQVRTGSPTGPILGSVAVPNTGDWSTFQDVTMPLTNAPVGTSDIYLTFAGSGTGLFDMDEFAFTSITSGPVLGQGGQCLDIQGGSTANGTAVQLYGCNLSAAQTWTRSGHTLKALGKCLDVSGGSTADGARVQIWDCNNTGAQNWVPQPDSSLVNPQSGKCLDVDGTLAKLRTCSPSSPSQKWNLTG